MEGIAKSCLQKGNFGENWYACLHKRNVKAISVETDPNLLKWT